MPIGKYTGTTEVNRRPQVVYVDNIESDKGVKDLLQHPIVSEAITRLERNLPTQLTYHSIEHSLDVIRESIGLASDDALSARETELLAIASAWHDIGYIHTPHNNEPLAAKSLCEYLQDNRDYSAEEISLLRQMILDTALIPQEKTLIQSPSTNLSRYLLDADLANFGRDDFFEKSELQRKEVGAALEPFQKSTLALLQAHNWLTPAATRKWSAKKEANLKALVALIDNE
jgi:predicted metal-dependent HD superfamily phosphohydrolase